jgi:outer membrane murein-binding lipoprotein Lpp
MTAAYRFRGWGWLLTSVVVALGCYMVSLQVAGERRKLDQAASAVRQARADIRRLETEFDARASMAQLEKWNGDSFRYAAPTADQFVGSTAQLASLDPRQPVEMASTDGAKVQMASLVVPAAAPDALPPAAPIPAPAAKGGVGLKPVPAVQVAEAKAAHKPHDIGSPIGRVVVAAVAPVPTRVLDRKPQMAMLDRKLLSDSTLGDLKSLARQESRGR